MYQKKYMTWQLSNPAPDLHLLIKIGRQSIGYFFSKIDKTKDFFSALYAN